MNVLRRAAIVGMIVVVGVIAVVWGVFSSVGREDGLQSAEARAALRWKAKRPASWNGKLFIVPGAAIFTEATQVRDVDARRHAVALSDGTSLWSHNAPNARHSLLGETLINSSTDGQGVTGIDSTTGEVLWRNKTTFSEHWTGEGQYVGEAKGASGSISGLSPRDGSTAWSLSREDLGSAAPKPERVYFADGVCLIHVWHTRDTPRMWGLIAVAADTGERLWQVAFSEAEYDRIVEVVCDETRAIVVLSEYRERRYVGLGSFPLWKFKIYDLKTGEELEQGLENRNYWEAGFDGPVIAGDMLLYGAYKREGCVLSDYSLRAYDIASGEPVWTYPLPGGWDRSLRMTVHDGEVLVAREDGLLSLDLKTGKPLWMLPMTTDIVSGPIVREGVVYFMDGDHNDRPATCCQDHRDAQASRAPSPGPHFLYALDLVKARQLGMPKEEAVSKQGE